MTITYPRIINHQQQKNYQKRQILTTKQTSTRTQNAQIWKSERIRQIILTIGSWPHWRDIQAPLWIWVSQQTENILRHVLMVSFIENILYIFYFLPSFFLIYTNMVWLMWLVLIYNFLTYWGIWVEYGSISHSLLLAGYIGNKMCGLMIVWKA